MEDFRPTKDLESGTLDEVIDLYSKVQVVILGQMSGDSI